MYGKDIHPALPAAGYFDSDAGGGADGVRFIDGYGDALQEIEVVQEQFCGVFCECFDEQERVFSAQFQQEFCGFLIIY